MALFGMEETALPDSGNRNFGGGGSLGDFGGTLGTVGSTVGDLLFGSEGDVATAPTLTPEQIAFLNQLVEFGGQEFQNIFNQLGALSDVSGITGQTAALQQQANLLGMESADIGRQARGLESTFVGLDRGLLEGEFAAIDEQTRQSLGDTLGGSERFSSGNQIIRGRLAQTAAIQKSQLLGNLLAQNARQQQQANQFQQSTSLAGQQQAIGQQANLLGFGNQLAGTNLQASALASNVLGQQLNFTTSGLGVSPFENIVTPGTQGAAPQILGIGGGIALGGLLSDERLKNETGDVETGLNEVLKMNGKKWNWKKELNVNSEEEWEGFMAQDIEKLIPNAVKENSEGIKIVNIYALIPTLVNSIKELNKKIEKLEA
jgi:hypothetical protein